MSQTEKDRFFERFEEIFRLNDARKRAKTKFEAARLEYKNAMAELNKHKSTILDMFKELDSDEVSAKSEKWNPTTIQDLSETIELLDYTWVRLKASRLSGLLS